MPNRLATQTSPYLLQHAENPVEWHPWGKQALELAQREDKPVLVSIGYSACHWCHVMAHESFEDKSTAQLMNRLFINIKVDREERPDVDAIYMEAVQALTGQGGWPLNVFLTPDGRPFFGGTYFPPAPRHGMASWREVLESVSSAYRQRRDDVLKNAAVLTQYISESQARSHPHDELASEILTRALSNAASQFDRNLGGFGTAPKFPQPLMLEFLLRMAVQTKDRTLLEFVEHSLQSMAHGGIYDQLGGGFHRYSVDSAWIVPHFEKMLYDNALLARLYTLAYQATGTALYSRVAQETLDYLLRELRSPEGAFYSAQDADSEGEEGKYYVWTRSEIEQALGDQANAFVLRYGVSDSGNFEGKSILTIGPTLDEVTRVLQRPRAEVEIELAEARQRLLRLRSQRIRPETDVKVLVSWNGLAIGAFALAGRVFGRQDYLSAAQTAANFISQHMWPGGELVRSWNREPGGTGAFLEDFAFLGEALLTLYETSFDAQHFAQARDIATDMVDRFWDPAAKAFFDVAADSNQLIARPRNLFDNPIPSGNAGAVSLLLRLDALVGEGEHSTKVETVLRSVSGMVSRAPTGFPALLSALDFFLSGPVQVGIVGAADDNRTLALVEKIFSGYHPNRVVSVGVAGATPLLAGREMIDGQPTAYVCRDFVCQLPVTDPVVLTV